MFRNRGYPTINLHSLTEETFIPSRQTFQRFDLVTFISGYIFVRTMHQQQWFHAGLGVRDNHRKRSIHSPQRHYSSESYFNHFIFCVIAQSLHCNLKAPFSVLLTVRSVRCNMRVKVPLLNHAVSCLVLTTHYSYPIGYVN